MTTQTHNHGKYRKSILDRLHPVARAYVTSDQALPALLRAIEPPRGALIQALLYIEECLDGRRLARDAIKSAELVPIEGADAELLMLMFSGWAELCCRINRPSEAQALIHRTQALISSGTLPEIRARLMLAESVLADATGNKDSRELILKHILKLLAPSAPRRKFYTWELGLFLAQRGRYLEFEAEIDGLEAQCNEHFGKGRLLLVRLVDAVETGQIAKAVRISEELAGHGDIPRNCLALRRDYAALLDLICKKGRSGNVESLPPPPGWLGVARCLMLGDTDEALRLARIEANRVLGSIFGSGFDSFNLVRAEISAGHGEAALRLLRMRQGRGNKHYLDDLFFARIERLLGNMPRAAAAFAHVLESVEHHRARGRLDFELQLARELTPSDVIELTRAAEQAPRRPRHAGSAAPADVVSVQPPRPDHQGIENLVGSSEGIRTVRETIARLADTDAPVLVTGETGTGKELVARALHAASRRGNQPFIAVNCGSIGEGLLESELFGHIRGAFTGAETTHKGLFEEAGTGTILLDEMGEILPRLQRALLRVLETGEIRAVGSSTTRKILCRIVAATNADLNRLAEAGVFRRDLLFRLQRLGIFIPPLRERREDILPLCHHFLDAGRQPGRHAVLSDDLIRTIQEYDWPGNVRELKNVVERMRLMHSDKLSYELQDLDLKFHTSNMPRPTAIALPAQPEPSPAAATVLAAEAPATAPDPARVRRSDDMPPADPQAELVADVVRQERTPMRRLDRLRELFVTCRKLSRHEIVRILGISPNTATKDLKALRDEGFVERIEPSRSSRSHYFVIKPGHTPS